MVHFYFLNLQSQEILPHNPTKFINFLLKFEPPNQFFIIERFLFDHKVEIAILRVASDINHPQVLQKREVNVNCVNYIARQFHNFQLLISSEEGSVDCVNVVVRCIKVLQLVVVEEKVRGNLENLIVFDVDDLKVWQAVEDIVRQVSDLVEIEVDFLQLRHVLEIPPHHMLHTRPR